MFCLVLCQDIIGGIHQTLKKYGRTGGGGGGRDFFMISVFKTDLHISELSSHVFISFI